MMRRENSKNVENVEIIEEPVEEIVHTPMGTTTKSTKPIKIGVHVMYEDEEYVVQSLKDNDEIFICMGDKEHTVKKSDVEVIE
jgi:hypothetical protein|nr:MAG TPA: hypothetical protein [Caudoviricetes sp.]